MSAPAEPRTRLQKRQLEDPNDVSITRAPQAPKKGRKKAVAGDAGDATPSAPGSILPASITNPTTADIDLSQEGQEPLPPPETTKRSKKKKSKKGEGESTLNRNSTEEPPSSLQQPVGDTGLELEPKDNVRTSSSRKIIPSNIAKQVALQEAAAQEKKAAKAKKKEKKAASTVINETPEETQAFLDRMRPPLTSTLVAAATLYRPTDTGAQPPPSTATDSTTSHKSTTLPDKRKALTHLVHAHHSPATPTPSVVSTYSSFSSLAPSESVSQAAPAPPPELRRPKLKGKKAKVASPSLLDVPASASSSRDASPLSEQLTDGDLAQYSSGLGVDPATIFDGIPADLAPILQMPEPLPGPLYVPERTTPLEPIDLSKLPAADRARAKAKRQLKVKDLKPNDRAVVTSALGRMGALLTTVCGFPDEDMAWVLACNANHWASMKHGRHLKLLQGSEYAKLLYDRIPMMRAGFVHENNRLDVALTYELKAASSSNALEENREKVHTLLDGVNFTCPSLDQLDAMYENGIFQNVLKFALFRSAESIGVTHHDLFKTITIPCLALAAAAVEKVLMAYKSGVHVDVSFNANEFTPIYFSHLATLVEIYKTPEAQEPLVNHLQRVASELRKPFLGIIRPQALINVRSRVPQAVIAARYRSRDPGATDPAPPADSGPGKRPLRSKPASAPAQGLLAQVQMKLRPLVRSVSSSSTPESDVVDAIYGSIPNGRNVSAEDFSPHLAKVTGSSDSEVQADRAGALKPNEVDAMEVGPPESDTDDDTGDDTEDDTGGDKPGSTTAMQPVKAGNNSSQEHDKLSSDSSESTDESDGEGAAGLAPTTQNPGDVTMRTAAASSSSEDDSDSDSGSGAGSDNDVDEAAAD